MSEFVPFVKNVKVRPLVPAGAEIKELVAHNFANGNRPSYGEIKTQFNAELSEKSANSRFSLSEHVANQMAVEKEEQRRFEKRVHEALNAELNRLKEQVLEDAYKEGLEKGRVEAYDKEKARLAQQLENLAALVSDLETAKQKMAEQYENTLLEVSLRIAKTLLHYEIENHPEVIAGTISEILNRIAKDDDVVIKIAPSEFEALGMIREELKNVSRSGRINFELDESLKPGACVVESMSGEIASFIDEKFHKLEEAVFKGVRSEKAEEVTGT